MRLSWLAIALTGMVALCVQSCSTTRRATERLTVQGSEFRAREARDSLREEISQNLNENLSEHEVVNWTVVQPSGDTLKVERVTNRTRQSGAELRVKNEEVRVVTVRDTVYIEQRDTVLVEKNRSFSNGTNQSGKTALHGTLKWIFAIIVALIGLIITVKVCLRKVL